MNARKANRKPSLTWLYLISGLVIVGLLAWTSYRMLQETPAREASVEIPGQGWVTVEFSTSPFPPLTTGTVMLSFMPRNARGVMVDLGPGLPFTFGQRGSDTAIGSGQATLDSMGMYYQAGVQFPQVGDYWLELDVMDGQTVRFQFNVRPAQ